MVFLYFHFFTILYIKYNDYLSKYILKTEFTINEFTVGKKILQEQ